MNSWSVQSSDGLIRIRFSLAKTAWSIDVVLGDLGDLEAGDLDQVGQPDVGDQVEVVGDDGDLAAVLEDDVAVGVDLGDLGVRRVVVADRRDVADGAVGHVDQDDDLLRLRRGVQDARLGQDLELDGGRRRRGRPWRLRRSSRGGTRSVLAFAGQPQAPLVGDLAQRLAEEQAGVGGERVDPPAADLAAEGQEVLVGQVAAEAEPEAPLAGRRAVAGPHVAAGLAEGGDHVAAEAHRGRVAPSPRP